MALHAGDIAPDFTLSDQHNQPHALSAYRGKWVLLYFYPKDDTPGCTKEACAFRDHFSAFQQLDLPVFGISVDSVKSHDKFVKKYDLPLTLLADENKEVVRLYGVWEKKMRCGRESEGTNRWSFLIAPDGTIAKIYEKVKPEQHAEDVLRDVAALSGK